MKDRTTFRRQYHFWTLFALQTPLSGVFVQPPRPTWPFVLRSRLWKSTRFRTALCAAIGFGTIPVSAQAQVIEIADDGSLQVFDSANRRGVRLRAVARARSGQFNVEESLDRAARTYGLDLGLLRAVAWQESRGNQSAVSVKGAIGIMQLMPGTAAALGVDPRDPEANINGGAAYLASLLEKFKMVELALAAYNAGPAAVLKYGGIPPYRETRNYVATIMLRWRSGSGAYSPATAPLQKAPLAIERTPVRREPALPVLLIEVPNE